MLGIAFRRDMHAAIIAGWLLGVARFAVKRAAVKELFEPTAFFVFEMDHVGRQSEFFAADIALADVVFCQDWRVVLVNAARNDPRARAERTGHAQLRHDGLSNKCGFIWQFVQKVGELIFNFESHDL